MFIFAPLLLATLVYGSAFNPTLDKRATCTVASAGNSGTDDVPAVVSAIKSCGNGGVIIFSAGKTYAIGSTLDITGCVNCQIQIEGTLKLSNDTGYWEGKRTVVYINGISGATITTTSGAGVFDGNGLPYWQVFNANSSYARPTLVYINNSKNINITKLRFKNAPNVFHSVTGGSSNVVYDTLTLDATPENGVTPKNTDGFDVGQSQYVTIKNIKVTNQDDCVAFKPGADFTTVTNITCTGSHGISVGSLGGGAGSTDTVTNVYVTKATMVNSTKAVGIKLYQGGSSHGIATVRNVTFDGVTVQGCGYAAQIQSCYGSASTADCNSAPSQSTVDAVYFKNFSGATSTEYDPVIADLDCPAAGTCNIYFSNFNIKSPSGKANVLCSNVDSNMGLPCSGSASG
ncbi:glycoside hydrolase family 28 protein [Sphaerobolus stellatus SS14]|uniref:Unplaced genomic scaffold SPHSTscaffold_72, whole genome shotgun sequence n=1 Tax=Sphaerobolus stellatus (strain SS14) TaxID=990650 RepID=A0A0C9VQ73_SPHS4|nr:glycoside hydrolase family 28 protein [Sphaerobolus stellatus SS14]